MATLQTLARIQTLIWVLIYGGLLTLVLGLASHSRAPVTAFWLMFVGTTLAAAGVLLIWVRARLQADD